MVIGERELTETEEFLSNMIKASGAEWGDKLARWREGQFNTVEDEVRVWVHRYAKHQVMEEVLAQLQEAIAGNIRSADETVYVALQRIASIAVIHGLTLGLELQRRYGE